LQRDNAKPNSGYCFGSSQVYEGEENMSENKALMSENLKLWNKVSKAPDWALKPIQGGRLTGKTDINPMWRNMCMTENFGMCGIGWKYVIDKTWTIDVSTGETMCFVQLSLFVKVDNQWSDAIQTIGGDMLLEKEKASMHANDDCFKMAITDALGKAFAMLGVAANIYAGTKYNRIGADDPQPSAPKAATPPLAPQAQPVIQDKPHYTKYMSYKSQADRAGGKTLNLFIQIMNDYLNKENITTEELREADYEAINKIITNYKAK
jgi:hypothetical protein